MKADRTNAPAICRRSRPRVSATDAINLFDTAWFYAQEPWDASTDI